MKTPKEWEAIFKSGMAMRHIKRIVEREARMHLQTIVESISTEKLVEALYPRKAAEQSVHGSIARKGIYVAIGKLALDGLDDCCVKGEVNGHYMGKPKRPWVWFCPDHIEEYCCMCGQLMPTELLQFNN